ncbi:F-box protein At3g07870-like [Coffea eugenioides]|uniref:F-box protein At3g07870-like n=1 Tax=Coffea eugenioides TaxID=49369 RepID=UPI000F614C99|nr:F-box protein At3g07870-like [Coffea eugenioides]
MSNQAPFLNLPAHVVSDILSRLPPKTIIQCKSVCKSWLSLLSESEFTNLHLLRSPPCLIINNLDYHPSDLNCFSLVEFEDQPDHHDFQYVAGTKIKAPKGCVVENGATATMVGSINGLICLNEFDHKHDAVCLWNPIIRESITLPIHRGGEETESWRRIGHAPFLYNSCRPHGVFLNGNLHWLIGDQAGSELISCFDLETELFSPFPAPPELSKDFNLACLGLFAGCLSLCDNTSDYEIVIWVMKEYGITKLWTKEIVIDKEPADLVGPSFEVVRVFKVFEDGNILLLWRDDILLSYDSRRQILHQSGVHKLIKKIDDQMNEDGYPCIEVMEYVPTFLSLESFGIQMMESIN